MGATAATRAFRRGRCRLPAIAACGIDGLPPGRQPRATSCDQAERLASRDRNARVIYGDDATQSQRRFALSRSDVGVVRPHLPNRTYPNIAPIGNTYPNNRGYGNNSVPFDNGYRDGLEKGREDAGTATPTIRCVTAGIAPASAATTAATARSDSYKLTYRDGFEAGYEEAYRDVRGYGPPAAVRVPRY